MLLYNILLSALEAYRKETKSPPPSTVKSFVTVTYFKSQGCEGTQKSWDAVLRRACLNLQLTGRNKKSNPHYDLAWRYLKRAEELEAECSKCETFLFCTPVKGLLTDPAFLQSSAAASPFTTRPKSEHTCLAQNGSACTITNPQFKTKKGQLGKEQWKRRVVQ